ncbi:MAG: DoxX family membrane protein [Spiribacter salinus]|uniref:DoxX family membrane protein n=1 Tax=Spiribacter salinus TaxID=1335746 RepID=A0A540VNG0_9GAMM|nr:MAG: DoxX family membrane protein [Spiribacter salinus]
MRIVSIYLLAGLFVVAGIAHLVRPQLFVRIMPPYLPAPLLLVYVSGAFEVLGGLGLLLPATRVVAGWGLMALLLAVFPANVHMALHPEAFPRIPAWSLYARLPLQFVLMGWVYWAACV